MLPLQPAGKFAETPPALCLQRPGRRSGKLAATNIRQGGQSMSSAVVNGIGVVAAVILMITLIAQTARQWREKTTRGVARWFFLGQVTASLGFVVYSVLTGSMLFAVTNALILLSALGGYVVLRLNRKRIGERLPAPSAETVRVSAPSGQMFVMHGGAAR